jgi:hypothetical protein
MIKGKWIKGLPSTRLRHLFIPVLRHVDYVHFNLPPDWAGLLLSSGDDRFGEHLYIY